MSCLCNDCSTQTLFYALPPFHAGEEMVFPLEDDAPPTLSPGLIDPDLLPAVQSFIDLFSLGVCTVVRIIILEQEHNHEK